MTEAQPPLSCVEGKIEVTEVGKGEEGHWDPVILKEVSRPTVLGSWEKQQRYKSDI